MKNITITDSRINRNNNVIGYVELANEIFALNGIEKRVSTKTGHMMSWDEFRITAYKCGSGDTEVKLVMDFNTNTATITIN